MIQKQHSYCLRKYINISVLVYVIEYTEDFKNGCDVQKLWKTIFCKS